MSATRTPVLVVGAGPAGCVLALELAHHGVRSTVVERALRPPADPGLTLVSGRGMELLRRLGLAERIRCEAVDPDSPSAVVWSQAVGEPPVLITPVPSANDLRRRYARRADGSAPVEPYALVAGTDLAACLRDAVRAHPLVDLREGWTFTDLRLEPARTSATVLDGATRTRHVIEAEHLAGCDGARSTVRRCLGVPLDDAMAPAHHCTVYFRSSSLPHPFPGPSTIIADGMALTRRSGDDLWIGHVPLGPDDAAVTDPLALLQRFGVDASEVVGFDQWQEALGIARTYRRGTAYLVGESAHRFHPPSATVDTCLADAVDLGWKLAAAIGRWGGPGLLGSYEDERRQQAVLEREMLFRSLETRQRFGRLAAAGASHDYLAGVLRAEPPQLDPAGTSPGSDHATSAVVWRDGTGPAATTRPGTRLPAVRLGGGEQLFDLLGPQLTLIDLTADGSGAPLVDTAVTRGIPMAYLRIDDRVLRASWRSRLVLVRPDHYVAWRAAAPPSRWELVLDVVTGHSLQAEAQDPVNA
ncbi:FAD-dependent monooxygenase [Actinoplanes sp. URMC 104]|uniref:FAD-dependent monooxygenase n=1 Tax=Actinoplanes sp. URMC 104 TaxID=3423409 RepID=UPI003F1A2654